MRRAAGRDPGAARGLDHVHKVMITGAAGLLGRVLSQQLAERGHDVLGVDRDAPRRGPVRRADMSKPASLDGLLDGVDVLVDLAANPSVDTPWEDVWRNNVPATRNALEAARLAGVRRVVFASSNHVTGEYERERPYSAIVAGDYDGLEPGGFPLIDPTWPIRPDGAYGLGKVLGEAAGRYYADEFGLSVLCLRIGTVNERGRPADVRQRATLLTHADLVGLVEACIAAPASLGYGIYYGVSANRWRFWSVANAVDDLGWRPRDDAHLL